MSVLLDLSVGFLWILILALLLDLVPSLLELCSLVLLDGEISSTTSNGFGLVLVHLVLLVLLDSLCVVLFLLILGAGWPLL